MMVEGIYYRIFEFFNFLPKLLERGALEVRRTESAHFHYITAAFHTMWKVEEVWGLGSNL
jgi:hypothetical protein